MLMQQFDRSILLPDSQTSCDNLWELAQILIDPSQVSAEQHDHLIENQAWKANPTIKVRHHRPCPMEDHIILRSRNALQSADPFLFALITESIESEPGYVYVDRIEASRPEGDRLRLHSEYLNPAGIPFGDTMKASVKPRSPALNAVGTAQVHGYRKSLFWWDVWSGSRKAVRHSHTCQRNLRVSLGTKHK